MDGAVAFASIGALERLWIWLLFVFWPPRIVRTLGLRPGEAFAGEEIWSRSASDGRAGLSGGGCCDGGLMGVSGRSTSISMSMANDNDMACSVELFRDVMAH